MEIESKEKRLDWADSNSYDNVGTLLDIFERANQIFEAKSTEGKKKLAGFLA